MINVTWLTSHGEMGPGVFHQLSMALIRNGIRSIPLQSTSYETEGLENIQWRRHQMTPTQVFWFVSKF